MVSLSVVLPTYNRGFIVEMFLQSLLEQSFHEWKLIIVDDASRDNTLQIVSKYANRDNRIHLYPLRVHRGLPAARNVGVAASRGELIFFGEDDITFCDKDTLKILINTYFKLEDNHKVGAVGPRLKKSRDDKWLNSVVKIGPISGGIYHNFDYDPQEVIEVPILHACSLVSKEAFQRVGGYDAKLYAGTLHPNEEVDFYYRIRKKGYKVFFQPKSTIHHHHVRYGGCSQQKNNLLRPYYYQLRNDLLFRARFHGILCSFKYLFLYPLLRMAFPRKAL